MKLLIPSIILFLSLPAAAKDKDKVEAEERFKKGLMFVDEGDCKKAIVEFREAYKSFPVPVILYNMALCYDDMHQYAMAMKYYKQYQAEEENISKDRLKAIKERMAVLDEFLGTLKIKCNVDGALVLVDGNTMGNTPIDEIFLETGDHELTIQKENFEDFNQDITIVSGKVKKLSVDLKSKSAGKGKKPALKEGKKKLRPAVFWGTLGATLALAASAGAVGGLNLANHKKFNDTDPSDRETLVDLKDKGEVYNALFLTFASAAGAAAVATIVVGVYTDFKKGKKVKKEHPAVGFLPLEGGGLFMFSAPLGNKVW